MLFFIRIPVKRTESGGGVAAQFDLTVISVVFQHRQSVGRWLLQRNVK
jgi:hypothetical protein